MNEKIKNQPETEIKETYIQDKDKAHFVARAEKFHRDSAAAQRRMARSTISRVVDTASLENHQFTLPPIQGEATMAVDQINKAVEFDQKADQLGDFASEHFDQITAESAKRAARKYE